MPQATARLPAPSLWHASLRLPDASSSSGHSPRRAEPRRTYSRTPVRSIRRMLANDDELGVWLRRSAHLSDSAVKQSIERLHVEEVFTVADLQVLQRISGFVRVFSPVTAQKVAGALAALEPRTASPAAPHSIAGVRFGGRSRLDFDATLDSARPHAHTPTPWQVLSKDQQLQLIASLRAEDATHALRDDSSSTGGLGSSSPGVRDASSPDAASGGSPVSVMAHGVPETAPLHYRYLGRAVDSPYSGHAPSMHMPLTPRLQAALGRIERLGDQEAHTFATDAAAAPALLEALDEAKAAFSEAGLGQADGVGKAGRESLDAAPLKGPGTLPASPPASGAPRQRTRQRGPASKDPAPRP